MCRHIIDPLVSLYISSACAVCCIKPNVGKRRQYVDGRPIAQALREAIEEEKRVKLLKARVVKDIELEARRQARMAKKQAKLDAAAAKLATKRMYERILRDHQRKSGRLAQAA
jgi:hypothetical protein